MNWLKRLLMGRYGSDQLNFALILFGLFLTLVAQILAISIVTFFAYLPLFFAIFRMFSKNISKRRAENNKFLKIWTRIKFWIKQKLTIIKQSRQFNFFKCPSCKAVIRVPRGKGKIEIHCPRCKTGFKRES